MPADAAYRNPPHYLAKVTTITIIQRRGPSKATSVYAITSLLAEPLLSLAPTPLATSSPPTPSPRGSLHPSSHNLSPPSAVPNSAMTASPPPPAQTTQPASTYAHSLNPPLTFILFVVIALAAAWTLTVCLIHYRGATAGYTQQRPCSPTPAARRWTWQPRRLNPVTFFKRAHGTEYEALDSDGEDDSAGSGLFSALELRMRDAINPSPLNPYLVAPGREPRAAGSAVGGYGEEEWKLRHRAFFGVGQGGDDAVDSSESRGAYSSSGTERESIVSEAREAQAREVLRACGVGTAAIDEEMRRCWVDVGLEAIDGVVDRFSARIVRWTDGGELVLPLAEGKRDGERRRRRRRGDGGQAMRVE
ncbi:hypothetical protein E8E13_005110 [Curvularia kusanoi]|uniref:Uncharacterized protein n=1 Tax=Curvularia kusanoi TaxID=90978 RepID=A0A9P4TNV6_CURKU|nr:hypothetical protein E8E13_005110 [Curvularia kusanoi]